MTTTLPTEASPAVHQIALVDLHRQYLAIKGEIDAAIARVVERANFTMGPEVEAFEESWAAYCGASHCVAVSSGTDAIYLAIRASQIHGRLKKGPVYVPDMTFAGTIEPAIRAGWEIEIIDVDSSATMDPKVVEYAADNYMRYHSFISGERPITVPVHLYGLPAAIKPQDGTVPGPVIIEDAAQAHGQTIRGHLMAFSFYPTKNLGAWGQGGAICTNNSELATILRKLRNHGEGSSRFIHEYSSGNYRMDELQAAILRAKLPHLKQWNTRRREIAAYYLDSLKDVRGLELPPVREGHVWHIFTLRHVGRLGICVSLAERGIQTSTRYPLAIHRQPFAGNAKVWLRNSLGGITMARSRDLVNLEHLTEADRWARTLFSIPCHEMMTDAEVEHVAKSVRTVVLARNAK